MRLVVEEEVATRIEQRYKSVQEEAEEQEYE